MFSSWCSTVHLFINYTVAIYIHQLQRAKHCSTANHNVCLIPTMIFTIIDAQCIHCADCHMAAFLVCLNPSMALVSHKNIERTIGSSYLNVIVCGTTIAVFTQYQCKFKHEWQKVKGDFVTKTKAQVIKKINSLKLLLP